MAEIVVIYALILPTVLAAWYIWIADPIGDSLAVALHWAPRAW